MIVVVDYGAGNIRSVTKALEYQGADVIVSSDPKKLEKADKIVLPGVGAFGQAMERLKAFGIANALKKALESNKPFLGICLGFQLLFERSDESPDIPGLSIFSGKVERFPNDLKVPHLGWNRVIQKKTSPLFYWRSSVEITALMSSGGQNGFVPL